MKYRCIAKYSVKDTVIMSPGDIVVIEGDKFFNVTTGVDYRNVPIMNRLKSYVEELTEGELVEDFYSTASTAEITDVDRFEVITRMMHEIFIKKNHDYGNSFEQSLNEEGLAGMRIRGGDKWLRFKNLSKGTNPFVKDESIRDTLLDLANYCIMTVMWMDKQK